MVFVCLFLSFKIGILKGLLSFHITMYVYKVDINILL